MNRKTLAFLAAIACCAVGTAYALYAVSNEGTWPKSWPKELEPLRKEAWTWEHGFGGMSYDIPFATREEFEAAWPHILTLKTKDARIYLLRGSHLRVAEGKSGAGVRVVPPREITSAEMEKLPANIVTAIWLVVDGEIVDLNRISLPADTLIIDERFKEEKKK